MAFLENMVLFVLLIGGLIFFHELGHFLVARWCKVRVLQFSIGFGPCLWAFERNGTEYRIGALPLGGYVKMLGMDPSEESEESDAPDSFSNQSLWRRMAIVFAGPAFNLILPFLVFMGLFLTASEIQPAVVGTVEPGGVAAQAGLVSGDRITEIDGEPVAGWWDLLRTVSSSPDQSLTLTVERDSEELPPLTLVPKRTAVALDNRLGVTEEVGRIQVSLQYIHPVVVVEKDSIAWESGLRPWDRIVAVNGVPVERWAVVERLLRTNNRSVTLTINREKSHEATTEGTGGLVLAAPEPSRLITLQTDQPERIADSLWGIRSAEWTVYHVEPNTPAAKAGLQKGDEVLGLLRSGDETPTRFSMWALMIREMAERMDDTHTLVIRRAGEELSVPMKLGERIEITEFNTEQPVIVFGAMNRCSHGQPERESNDNRMAYAAWRTWTESTNLMKLTLAGLGGLFTGTVKFKEMGGPIFMYQLASKTGERGVSYFFQIMAMLSISLGLINLLPIPLLDGGHLLFFVLEGIKRRPVSLRTRQIASYVGFSAIILLMVLVFKNDLERIWFMP